MFFSFILLIHEGSHRNSNPVMTSSADGAKGCSDHRFRAPPAYTVQLLTLHQQRANNQYSVSKLEGNLDWLVFEFEDLVGLKRKFRMKFCVDEVWWLY